MPTGLSNISREGTRLPQVIQLGSGSWDWNLNAVYTIRLKKVGLNLDAMYKINGSNAQNYHFGNRFTGSARLFYWANWKGITFLPQAGLFADAAKADEATGIIQAADGDAVRQGFYKIATYDGLIKKYDKPFSPTNHDALGVNDYVWAQFVDNRILPVGPGN